MQLVQRRLHSEVLSVGITKPLRRVRSVHIPICQWILPQILRTLDAYRVLGQLVVRPHAEQHLREPLPDSVRHSVRLQRRYQLYVGRHGCTLHSCVQFDLHAVCRCYQRQQLLEPLHGAGNVPIQQHQHRFSSTMHIAMLLRVQQRCGLRG